MRMKKALLLLVVISLISCMSEEEKKKAKMEEKVYSTLIRQAKSLLSDPSSFEFEEMYNYIVNDSIDVYALKFSGLYFTGKYSTKYAIGYFNINAGYEVDRSLLQFQASEEDLNRVYKLLAPEY